MKIDKWVRYWLITGCVLLFFQIVIGGVTRLTGSGLSITRWEIVTGTLPPLNEGQWLDAFDLYKKTPQFEKVNYSISLNDFKFIYFWEYFHRLWARLMGIIFLGPFLFFSFKGMLNRLLYRQLVYVIFFAALAAIFGWIMVSSGLINRPWVNAYNLSLHLGIAMTTLGILFWTVLMTFHGFKDGVTIPQAYSQHIKIILGLFIAQVFFGAVLSGMRAALYYPSWPDMNGSFIPQVLFDISEWRVDNIVSYDTNTFMPAMIHVLHRNLGYIVFIYGLYIIFRYYRKLRSPVLIKLNLLFVTLLITQVTLGVLTLIYTSAAIPVVFGVLHQAVAILIFLCLLAMIYTLRQAVK